jgi:hypothetical protein
MESAIAARAANAAASEFMVAMEDITRFRPRRSPPSVESNSSGPETYGGTVEGSPARAGVEVWTVEGATIDGKATAWIRHKLSFDTSGC